MSSLLDASTLSYFERWHGFISIECKLDWRFLYVNAYLARKAGFKRAAEASNQSYYHLQPQTSLSQETFYQLNQRVIREDCAVQCLYVGLNKYAQWHTSLGCIAPFYRAPADSIGIIYQGIETTVKHARLGQFLGALAPGDNPATDSRCYELNNPHSKRCLSERQMYILFFVLRDISCREIAQALHLSFYAVEYHLEQLQYKFAVNNYHELLWRALFEGYERIIPKSFINSRQIDALLQMQLPHHKIRLFAGELPWSATTTVSPKPKPHEVG